MRIKQKAQLSFLQDFLWTDTQRPVYVYVYMYVRTYLFMYVCVYVYVCVYARLYI